MRRTRRRGQAMLEYTMVTHALLFGGVCVMWPFLSYMLRALTIYFQSIYFVLNAAVP